MLILPCAAIALLIYHTITAIKLAARRQDQTAMRISSARATDLEQWRSIDC